MWDLMVSVPDHCLSFYFPNDYAYYLSSHAESNQNLGR